MNTSHHRSVNAKAKTSSIRSSRYFKLCNDWYFMTREGVGIGPYVDLAEARSAVSHFIAFIAVADNQSVQAFFEACGLKNVANVGTRC